MKKGFVLLVLLVTQALGQGHQWKKIEIDGVAYVSMADVASFYRFNDPVNDGEKVILKNKDVTMVFEGGSKEADFNGVGFLLSQELLKKDGEFLLSTTDLNLIVDSVLRPARVRGLGKFDTVIFSLAFPKDGPDGKGFKSELEKKVNALGFKTVFVEDRLQVIQLQDRLGNEGAVYLEVVVLEGKRAILKTQSLGASAKPGLALSTGLHWSVLQGFKRSKVVALEDGRITLGNGEQLKKLKLPASRMELTMAFSDNEGAQVAPGRFDRGMAKFVGAALGFTRKAAQQRAEKEVAAEEK